MDNPKMPNHNQIDPILTPRLGVNRVPALIQPDHDALSITVPQEPLA